MKEGSSRNSVIIENAAQSILDICKEDFSWIEKAMKTLDNEWNGRAAEELFKHYYSLKSKQAKLDKDINDYGITLQKIATSANGIEKTNKQLGDSINSGQENMVGYPPFEQISSIHPTDRQNEQDSHTPNNDVLKTCQIPLDKNGNVINYNPIQFEYGTIETRQGIVSDRGHIRYVTQTCDKSQTISGTKTYDKYNPYYFDDYWIAGTRHYNPKSECNTACISMAYSYLGLDYTPADLFQMWNGKSKNGGKNGSTIPGRVPESKGSKIQAPVGVKHVSGKNKSFTEMFNDYKNSAESGEYEYSPIIIQIRDKHKLDDGGTYSHYVMVIDKVEGKGNEYVIVDPYSTNKSKITKTVTIDDYGDSYTVSSKDYQKNIHHTNTSDNLKQYYRPKENDICFKQLYEMQ